MELDTQICIAEQQGYLADGVEEKLGTRLERVFALVSGLISAKRRAVST